MNSLPRSRSRRTGFTLVELLVVMAIIGVLVSMLMPAIQRVRESARMTECESRLHNINIAVQNYANSHTTYPSGYIAGVTSTQSPMRGTFGEPIRVRSKNGQEIIIKDWSMAPEWTWLAFITPQMEEINVQPDYRQPKTSNFNLGAIRTTVKSYVCPSADLPASRPQGWAYGTYRANVGTTTDNGVMYLNSGVRPSDVSNRDGTSYTIMCGDSMFGFWGDSGSCCARFNPQRPINQQWDSYWARQRNVGTNDAYTSHYTGWGSWHGDLAIFAFCDGSVRRISKSKDINVLYAMSTRNGGERIDE